MTATEKEHIHSEKLLTIAECKQVADKVKSLDKFWINRGGFYTLGAATYQDNPLAYPAIANAFNPIINQHFVRLLSHVSCVISKLKNAELTTLPNLALPSFHVFDQEANDAEGQIHVDEPYERIALPEGWHDPFSFTMAVELPAGGGGMNYWKDERVSDKYMAQYLQGRYRSSSIPKPEYLPYELGVLYVHSGLFPHQIANPCTIGKDEHRITLQGHGVILSTGHVVLYF